MPQEFQKTKDVRTFDELFKIIFTNYRPYEVEVNYDFLHISDNTISQLNEGWFHGLELLTNKGLKIGIPANKGKEGGGASSTDKGIEGYFYGVEDVKKINRPKDMVNVRVYDPTKVIQDTNSVFDFGDHIPELAIIKEATDTSMKITLYAGVKDYIPNYIPINTAA